MLLFSDRDSLSHGRQNGWGKNNLFIFLPTPHSGQNILYLSDPEEFGEKRR